MMLTGFGFSKEEKKHEKGVGILVDKNTIFAIKESKPVSVQQNHSHQTDGQANEDIT